MNTNLFLPSDTYSQGRVKINEWMNKVKRMLEARHGANFEIFHDADRNPIGVFRRIPLTLHTHANGFAETTTPHTAFLVNGAYVSEIWLACFLMSAVNENGVLITDQNPSNSSDAGGGADNYPTRSGGSHPCCARNFPGVDPLVKADWDWCKKAADNLNTGGIAGFHMMTDPEYSLLAYLAQAYYLGGAKWPAGNCNHGRDIDRKYLCGRMVSGHGQVADGVNPSRTLTGSLPESDFLGIYDLKGLICEWALGLKIVDGIAKVLPNTNTGGTAPGNSFAALEANWYNTALNITTGITSGQKITSLRTDIPGLWIPATCDVTGHVNYDYAGFWYSASGERVARRGASWTTGTNAAVGAMDLRSARSIRCWCSGSRLGFIGDLSLVI